MNKSARAKIYDAVSWSDSNTQQGGYENKCKLFAVIEFLAHPENNASRKVVESMGVPKKLIDELIPELIAERDKTVEEWSKEFTKNFADVKDIALGDKVGEDI